MKFRTNLSKESYFYTYWGFITDNWVEPPTDWCDSSYIKNNTDEFYCYDIDGNEIYVDDYFIHTGGYDSDDNHNYKCFELYKVEKDLYLRSRLESVTDDNCIFRVLPNRKYIDKIVCKYNGGFWLNVLLSDIYGTTVKNMPDIKVFFNYEKSYENHLKSFDEKLSNKRDFYLYKSYCPEYVVIDGKRRKMYNDKNICYFNYNNKKYEFSCFDIEKFDIE